MIQYLGPWYVAYYDDNNEPIQYHRDGLDPLDDVIIWKWGKDNEWCVDSYHVMKFPPDERPAYATYQTIK